MAVSPREKELLRVVDLGIKKYHKVVERTGESRTFFGKRAKDVKEHNLNRLYLLNVKNSGATYIEDVYVMEILKNL